HYNGAPFGTLKAEVELLPLPPVASHSKFEVKPDTIKANGKEAATLDFTAKDINEKPISGLTDVLTFIIASADNKPLPPGDLTLSPIRETIEGNYRATLTTKIPGELTIIPRVESDTMNSLKANLTVSTLPPSEAHSDIYSWPTKILADDVDHSTHTVVVRNEFNQVMWDILDRVSFLVTDKTGKPAADVNLSAVTSTPSGYQVTLRGPNVGEYEVIPLVDGKRMETLKRPIELLTTEITAFVFNRHEFPIKSQLPTTAYLEGVIAPVLANNADPTDYVWTSTANWLTPGHNGPYLRFTASPGPDASGTITVTGTRKGSAVSHSYTLKIKTWYHVEPDWITWTDAMNACQSQGLNPVSAKEVSIGEGIRTVGSLTSEWGYIQTHNSVTPIWLSDSAGTGRHMALARQHELPTGRVDVREDADKFRGLCSRQLK
ncbi:invasin domain 3-containing protein, partial [Pseudomonas sp. NY15354]|uniref:invasin domain 3-containing protein n=1 Tax=Pseudomonas sp. NY15354 TaxID=3400351 RepID=UPI003A8787A5